jgi:hypothetical protein
MCILYFISNLVISDILFERVLHGTGRYADFPDSLVLDAL